MLSDMLTLNKENINFRRGKQLNSKAIVTKVNLIWTKNWFCLMDSEN